MSSPDVATGVYTDYSQIVGLRTRYLVDSTQSYVLTNIMGILVPLALTRLASSVLCFYLHDYAAVVRGDTPEGFGWGYIQLALRYFGGRFGRIRLGNAIHGSLHLHEDFYQYLVLGMCGIFYYIIAITCGILTAKLASDNKMLSRSPQCGLYLPSTTNLVPGQAPLDWHVSVLPYVYEAELDSATWAKNCYGNIDNEDGCGLFVQRQIAYDVQENASCPFADDMCYHGRNSGIRFYTQPIKSSSLGINAPRTFDIRRSMECAPINRNETFIRATKNGTSVVFRYYYGESWTWGNASHLTTSDGKLINAATYELIALPSGMDTYWKPLPSLRPPANATTTLLFILSGKIYHEQSRDDPVFPADRARYMNSGAPGAMRQYWINSLGHATVLGCVDRTEWRDPHYGKEWSPSWEKLQQRPSDPKVRAAAWLLYYSIQNSNIYYSVNARSAGALDAQTRLTRFYFSLPLADEQWKVEAKQLFETSLARIQMNLKAIARGELAKYPGFAKVDASQVTEGDPVDICNGTYIFRGHGYTNIHLIPWLVLLILGCLVVVCAVPFDDEHSDQAQLLGVICYRALCTAAKQVWNFFKLLKLIFDLLKSA